MSHCARSQIASASRPDMAVVTSKYSAVSRASSSFTFAGMSSTTRIRAVIGPSGCSQKVANGFDEFADRDRLRQIGLAAALADPLLVALHGERRDGDDWDDLQLRVVLEPFGDLKARYFGKLDVHQHKVGTVLASEIERFDAVARADGV